MYRSLVRLGLVALLAIALVPYDAAAGPSGGDREPRGGVARVRMVDGNRFRPRTLTVPRGTRVRWVNRDNVSHTTTSNDGSWSEVLEPGDRFVRRFRRRGEFPYRCEFHVGMTGTIVVTRR